MIPLNLTSIPFGIYKLLEIVTVYPMNLAPAYFDPQLIKGKELQYCKCVMASIKNNHVLVDQSFQMAPLGDKDLKCHNLQLGDFIY